MLSSGDDEAGDGAPGGWDVDRPVDAYRLDRAEKKAVVISNELRDCSRLGCSFSCLIQLGDRLVSWIQFSARQSRCREEMTYMWKGMKRFRELRSLRLPDICSPSKALQRYHCEQRQRARAGNQISPEFGRQQTKRVCRRQCT